MGRLGHGADIEGPSELLEGACDATIVGFAMP
jgi:hypothetical protein